MNESEYREYDGEKAWESWLHKGMSLRSMESHNAKFVEAAIEAKLSEIAQPQAIYYPKEV